MDELQEEKIKMKKYSKKRRTEKFLSYFQKIIFFIILILIIILIYNIYLLSKYWIKNRIDEKIQIEKLKEKYKFKDEDNKNSIKNEKVKRDKKNKKKNNKNNKEITESLINFTYSQLLNELKIEKLYEINKKRTFEKRYPLPKEIKCQEHLREAGLVDMMVFTSFLTNNTIFFEFASGCSTIIAKYYSKKAYAVEGNKKWYDIGINNGLKDNLIFKDLKCDGTGPLLSWPGKKSTKEDWKSFIQAYKKEYNADVIFVDGRFRVACIFDIFNKIRNDTVVLLHECHRSQYSIIKEYYNLVYHWSSLCLYQKKTNLTEIPLEILEKYWNEKV